MIEEKVIIGQIPDAIQVLLQLGEHLLGRGLADDVAVPGLAFHRAVKVEVNFGHDMAPFLGVVVCEAE